MTLPSIFRGHFGTRLPARAPFAAGDLDRLFDELWRGFDAGVAWPAAAAGFAPRLDVVETEAEVRVAAELPGLEEKDFSVEVEGDRLTIRGEKRSEREERDEGWHRAERTYGRFERSVALPVEVESDKASASFRNGVLSVTLPKAETARVRQIPIETS